jgi:thioredoxin-like negative regulator of GroEL
MDSLVDHFMRLHRGKVKLAKVELTDRPDLARRFRVSSAPTILLLQDLHEQVRLEGRTTLPGIKAALEPYIEEQVATEAISANRRELALTV